MAFKVNYVPNFPRWEKVPGDYYDPIEIAATEAIRDAGNIVKLEGRADIAKAGFGTRWQNTLRVNFYPTRGASVDASAYIYHKIPYAGVFETGAVIRGKPTMWLPLRGTPKKLARRKITPEAISLAAGKPLLAIRRAGRDPLLAMSVHMSKAKARQREPKITVGMLRRGPSKRSVSKSIPLFVGIDTVKIRKRFNIAKITSNAAGRLAELYFQNLEG
jgi:hypothetical protein